MSNIYELYKNIIMNGFYDEQYGMKSEIIEGKKHGVCIDFSKELIGKLRENGYLAGLISTLTEDGFMHAAVLYKDLKTGEVNIADPVADVRKLTGLTDEQRQEVIDEILQNGNWNKNLQEYISENGDITEWLDNLVQIRQGITDDKELRENINLRFANQPIHIEHPIEKINDISQIDQLVEDPMKEACKILYKKGISTSCSDNLEGEKRAEIFLPYTSLSEENKRKLIELSKVDSAHYEFRCPGGSWMRQTKLDAPVNENDYSQARGFVIKFDYKDNQTMGDVSDRLVELSQVFEKQLYMERIYTREDILRNIHKLEDVSNLLSGARDIVLSEPAKSQKTNKQLAKLNGLNYSERFNIFYESPSDKTRYLESLYRDEKGNMRSKQQIASENQLVYDKDSHMIFETEQELEEYRRNSYITSADIVEADMYRKVSKTKIGQIRKFFNKIKERIKGIGDR